MAAFWSSLVLVIVAFASRTQSEEEAPCTATNRGGPGGLLMCEPPREKCFPAGSTMAGVCHCTWREWTFGRDEYDLRPEKGIYMTCSPIRPFRWDVGQIGADTKYLAVRTSSEDFFSILTDPQLKKLEFLQIELQNVHRVRFSKSIEMEENIRSLKSLTIFGDWSLYMVEDKMFNQLLHQTIEKIILEDSGLSKMWSENWDYFEAVEAEFGIWIVENIERPIRLECDCNVWKARKFLHADCINKKGNWDIIAVREDMVDPDNCGGGAMLGKQVSACTTSWQHTMPFLLLLPVMHGILRQFQHD